MNLTPVFTFMQQRNLTYFSGQSHEGCFTISFSEGRGGRGSYVEFTQTHPADTVEVIASFQSDDGERERMENTYSDLDVAVREFTNWFDSKQSTQDK